MKKYLVLGILLMATLVIGMPAIAEITIQPNGDCLPAWGDECVGSYDWDQMGHFEGETWIWDADFVAMLDEYHYSTPNNYPNYWEVIKMTDAVLEGNNIRMDRRYTVEENYTSVVLDLETVDEVIWYPEVWVTENGEGDQWIEIGYGPGVYPDGASQDDCSLEDPHGHCDELRADHEDPCCRPFIDAQEAMIEKTGCSPIDYERIDSVYWDEQQRYADQSTPDGGHIRMLEYDSGSRTWRHNGYEETYGPDPRFKWPGILAELGEQHIEITYDGSEEYTLTFYVSDVREMPVIPEVVEELVYTKVKEGGKDKEKVEKVNHLNIEVREVVDPLNPYAGPALVVQWPEPDEALFGGMQLRLYVGTNNPGYDDFLWTDCPVQIGTVVVPSDEWGALKARMIQGGLTEVFIQFQYRVADFRFHNRGYSDLVTFPIQ